MNVKVSNTSSTALTVTWNPPTQHEIHGKIRQYSIRYRRINCSSAFTNLTAWRYENVKGATMHALLKNLAKWSCYSVQISAVTIRKGKWSAEIQHRTTEDGKIIDITP